MGESWRWLGNITRCARGRDGEREGEMGEGERDGEREGEKISMVV